MSKFDFNEYNKAYKKAKYKQYSILIPLEDKDIIDYLSKQSSISKCIKTLIKEAIENEKIIENLKDI